MQQLPQAHAEAVIPRARTGEINTHTTHVCTHGTNTHASMAHASTQTTWARARTHTCRHAHMHTWCIPPRVLADAMVPQQRRLWSPWRHVFHPQHLLPAAIGPRKLCAAGHGRGLPPATQKTYENGRAQVLHSAGQHAAGSGWQRERASGDINAPN